MRKHNYTALKRSDNDFSATEFQVNMLENRLKNNVSFNDKLREMGLFPLKPGEISVLQINIGKMCNQTCSHCHVGAGPDKTEIMTRATMIQCLEVIKTNKFKTVDLTGGAPEYNPDFRWFIEKIRNQNKNIEIIIRSNLTIINEREEYLDLPEFYKKNDLTIISSLPCYTKDNVDWQRGGGVFKRSIDALKKLNKLGYGQNGSDLILNLVYNPSGASLPGSQMKLQEDYKNELEKKYSIVFNELYTITNMPINRYLNFLVKEGKFEEYMQKLIDNFNPSAVMAVMCRNTLSINWEGYIFDCDFNQQLGLNVDSSTAQQIKGFDFDKFSRREIVTGQHCYGCTACEGSGCNGALDLK